MKLITAVIKPFKLDDVRESAAQEVGVQGMTVTEVKGLTADKRATRNYIAVRNTLGFHSR